MAAKKAKESGVRLITGRVGPLATPGEAADALAWLAESKVGGLEFLLATTYGEVVWGLNRGGWTLSNGGNALPAATLLELRAFGPMSEVFVWRDASGLHARLRVDGGTGRRPGTLLRRRANSLGNGARRPAGRTTEFTPLRDGDQGLRHAPPLTLGPEHFDSANGHRPARLLLRHYVGRDEATGVARVVDTRLVGVVARTPKGKQPTEVSDESAA